MTAVSSPEPEVELVRVVTEATAARHTVLFTADGTSRVRSHLPGLADVTDGLPLEALDGFVAVTDAGPLREAGSWSDACAALGISCAVALAVRPEAGARRVLVVGDPADPLGAADLLDGLARDIEMALTVTHRLRDARERSARADERARLSEDLVAIVSHELRTPLTSIIGSLQTLQRPQLGPISEDGRRLLETARTQADRLRVLVDDLLVASRLDRKVLRVRMQPVDAAAVVDEVLDLVPGARDQLTVDAPDGLPKPVLDPDHVARIVRNLVENVLRHAPGAPAEITLAVDGEALKVEVVDHGPGVADPTRLFHRSAPPAGTDGGLGLGLAIAKGLTDSLNGTITHAPTPDGGATFRVLLPLG